MRPILFFVVLVLLGVTLCGQPPKCPKVYDGLTNGHFDLSTQFSTNTLSANWVGLSSTDIISYECAVVSESYLRNNLNSGLCRETQGFSGVPNIKNWINVRKENSVTFNNLNLEPTTKYFVVLRTTLTNGVQVFSNSDGIIVLPKELNLEGSTSGKRDAEPETTKSNQLRSAAQANECPIDEANRCRAGQVSVQDFLNEFYGPPRFQDNFLFVLPVAAANDDDDDDDDDATENHGIIGGVIGGVLLLCLLCLLLLALLALLFNKNGGDEPFSERIVERKQEHVDADLGSSTQHQIASDTRVEFPDIDPHSRLSQA